MLCQKVSIWLPSCCKNSWFLKIHQLKNYSVPVQSYKRWTHKRQVVQTWDLQTSDSTILGRTGTNIGQYQLQTSKNVRLVQKSDQYKRQTMGGVQSSSTSNHHHPNVFCGKNAPQLVISTTSITNHRKLLFSEIWIWCTFNINFDIYWGFMASVLT